MEVYSNVLIALIVIIVVAISALFKAQTLRKEGGGESGTVLSEIAQTLIIIPILGFIAYIYLMLPMKLYLGLKDGDPATYTLILGILTFIAWGGAIACFKKLGVSIVFGLLIIVFAALPLTGLTLFGLFLLS